MNLKFTTTSSALEGNSSYRLAILEDHFLRHQVEIESWLRSQWQKTKPLFYGSVDLRNSSYKVAPVDTNLFPAGFNNLNPVYLPLYVEAVRSVMNDICPQATRLLLIPESHSRNLYYFENIAVLQEILCNAGFAVRIGSLDPSLQTAETTNLPSGRSIRREPLMREGDRVGVQDFFPCCILLNNDLSDGVPEILQHISQIVLPPIALGWHRRLKSQHFQCYEEVSNEFAAHLSFDPWLISPFFDQCSAVDFSNAEGRDELIHKSEALFTKIQKKYQDYKIDQPPFLVIKADQGTYGMAVMMIKDPQELNQLNRKQRTHMSTSKGGVSVTKAIIQEGIYTFETVGETKAVAEPVVYLMGRCVIGGFYRVHKNRGIDENLNAPGMDFHPLPFEKPCNLPDAHSEHPAHRFYLYGVVSRLAMLAAARESQALTGVF